MKQFKFIGTNHIQKFSSLMGFYQITPEQALLEGLDEGLVGEMDEKAKSIGLAIIAIPIEMTEQWGQQLEVRMENDGSALIDAKIYTFVNISGDRKIRNGVMVPVEITDKPDRENPIGEDDVNQLKDLLDSCTNFDEFLKNL